MLTKEEIDKALSPDMDKQVYYDPRTDILFTVWRTEKGKVIIGGLSEFYDSAITGLFRYSITKKYFDGCQPITKDSDLLTDYHFKSCTLSARVLKGHTSVYDIDSWCKNISNNPQFVYLPETDELVRENMIRNPFLDMDSDIDD